MTDSYVFELPLAGAMRTRAGVITVYIIQVRKEYLDAEVVEHLYDFGWTTQVDAELESTVLFSTVDEGLAFECLPSKWWDETPIDGMIEVDRAPFDEVDLDHQPWHTRREVASLRS